MENIIVSACLLGYNCRYDGKVKPIDASILKLKEKYNLIPVCAEQLGGLPTPRIGAEIVGNRVMRSDGADVTKEYNIGAEKVLEIAKQNSCKIAILKSKSPSCGKYSVYDGTFTKTLREGSGILAKLLCDNGIKIFDENETWRVLENENNSK